MDFLQPPSENLTALPAFEKHLSVIKGSGAKTGKRYSGYVAAFDVYLSARLLPKGEGVRLAAVQQTNIDGLAEASFFQWQHRQCCAGDKIDKEMANVRGDINRLEAGQAALQQ